MHDRIIELLVQKLTFALSEVDSRTRETVLAEWSLVNPSPQCPFVGVLMNRIHLALIAGCKERESIAKQIIKTTLKPFQMHLTNEIARLIMVRVNALLPEDNLLSLIEKTPDVYVRSNAPETKFHLDTYSLELSLITTSIVNITRHSVANIQIIIEEILLLEAIAKPKKTVWWKRFVEMIWKFILITGKWMLGILSAVIVAAIIYFMGIK